MWPSGGMGDARLEGGLEDTRMFFDLEHWMCVHAVVSTNYFISFFLSSNLNF